jgi:hypothetical protein
MKLNDRLKHGWNAFKNKEPTDSYQSGYRNPNPSNQELGPGYYRRPDRVVISSTTTQSIVGALYNRIAVDIAAVTISHVRLDENKRYLEDVDSSINYALTIEANIDQTGRALIQDIAMSMFDEGCIAVIPVDTTIDPKISNSYEIQTLRVGKIVQWYPEHIKVELYNQRTGYTEPITVEKRVAAIIENPLFQVMNEPNSTLKRLIRKLNILDSIDEQSGAGKLDIIIQLPYVIKTEARRQQAENRRKDIEMQLSGSKFGIAYADGTEKITQLNRPAENNLMGQITYLTSMLYNQLGLTESVFDGTADEKTMLNYYNRTINPCLTAITDEMHRKYLTKTARTQRQAITYFKDPFRLVPVTELANIADKFTRNEVLSSNEVRGIIGFKPSSDPKAEELRNKNLNNPNLLPDSVPVEDPEIIADNTASDTAATNVIIEQDKIMNDLLLSLEGDVDKILGGNQNE